VGQGLTFAKYLAELRVQRGLSQRTLATRAHIAHGYLSELEAGSKSPGATTAAKLDEALGAGGRLAALAAHRPVPRRASLAPIVHLETLRRQVTETITSSGIGPAAVEDWEQTVLDHGRATRYRPPAALLVDLAHDFTELCGQMQVRHSSLTLRRLTRVVAQMAGLMFLTLIKLDEQDAARSWARVARIAAREAGDPTLQSWVRAQEAFVHYYSDRYGEALAVARHARNLVSGRACVGGALAAAIEARTLGRLDRREEALACIGTAEGILSGLDREAVIESAFGYNEAQLRFHEGNTLTHLADTGEAWRAQQRALALYPVDDYLDRTLVCLDRASCLAGEGDASGAMAYATQAFTALSDEMRQGLLTARGREMFESLPSPARALPAARDFRELLMITAGSEGTDS
jgi:transcriptional regulator with XRE-family HTH domain